MDPALIGALAELGKMAFEYRTKRKLAEMNRDEALAAVVAETAAFQARPSREAFDEAVAAGGGAGDAPVKNPQFKGTPDQDA